MTGWLISPKAEDDLVDILTFIDGQTGSDRRSADLLSDFVRSFDLLAAQPHMGSTRPILTGTDIRWWWVHQYAILYEPSQPVRILRIVHGARSLDSILRG